MSKELVKIPAKWREYAPICVAIMAAYAFGMGLYLVIGIIFKR